MDENAYSWLVDFILGCLSDDEKKRITAEAEKRYSKIAEMVERNPLSPSTIAERALEHYLNNEAA